MALAVMNAGPLVKFHGPPPADFGSTVQFWVYGGSVSLEVAARAVLGVRYADERMYKLGPADSGARMFAQLWEEGAALLLHGRVFWVADSLVVAVKKDPMVKWGGGGVFVPPIVELF